MQIYLCSNKLNLQLAPKAGSKILNILYFLHFPYDLLYVELTLNPLLKPGA